MNKSNQVWTWNTFQRSTDSLMNKAYIVACKKLVNRAFEINPSASKILDIGAGSGLVLRHIDQSKNFTYLGTDINTDGLEKIKLRAEKLGIKDKAFVQVLDACEFDQLHFKKYDMIFSNFCLYTIVDRSKRITALKNIRSYLSDSGTFHIALPSERYAALDIAKQCFKEEVIDKQNFVSKCIRFLFLVPYQWEFVLKPIENRINSGEFLRFSRDQIVTEFLEAGLKIDELYLYYGRSGYHIHGHSS